MAAEACRTCVLTSFRCSRAGTSPLSIRAADSRGDQSLDLQPSRRLSCRSAFTTRRSTASAGSLTGSGCSATSRVWARLIFEAAARSTPKRYDFCDVLVVGAGPSGLAAALAAAERGASVLLVDENPAAGGSGLYARGGASDNRRANRGAHRVRARQFAHTTSDRHVRRGILRRSLGCPGRARVPGESSRAQRHRRAGRLRAAGCLSWQRPAWRHARERGATAPLSPRGRRRAPYRRSDFERGRLCGRAGCPRPRSGSGGGAGLAARARAALQTGGGRVGQTRRSDSLRRAADRGRCSRGR